MAVTLLPDGHYAADDTADIEKFTDMIHKILKAAWGSDWGTFSDESPTGNNPEETKLPHITYNVTSRLPKRDRSLKMTQFDSFPDPDNPGHNITLYKQWFDCEMEFVMYTATRKEATRLSQRFEEFMMTYIGYFKQQGIQEIVFEEEVSPSTTSLARQDFATRTLVYRVIVERITAVRSVHIREISELTKVGGEPIGVEIPDTTADGGNMMPQRAAESSEFSSRGSNDFLELYNKHTK